MMHGYWFFNLWRHYQTHKQFDLDEQKEIAYMVGEVCYLRFKMILMIRNKITTWLDKVSYDNLLLRVRDCLTRSAAQKDVRED